MASSPYQNCDLLNPFACSSTFHACNTLFFTRHTSKIFCCQFYSDVTQISDLLLISKKQHTVLHFITSHCLECNGAQWQWCTLLVLIVSTEHRHNNSLQYFFAFWETGSRHVVCIAQLKQLLEQAEFVCQTQMCLTVNDMSKLNCWTNASDSWNHTFNLISYKYKAEMHLLSTKQFFPTYY